MTSPTGRLDDAIERALAFLERRQLSSGSFPLYKSNDPAMIEGCQLDPCVFPEALIAWSLAFVPGHKAAAIVRAVTGFLLAERRPGSVWAHFARANPISTGLPPDIDTTSCASLALERAGVATAGNRALLLAVRDERGRFYTWITIRKRRSRSIRYWATVLPQLRHPLIFFAFWKRTPASPYDVDCVVNANAIFWLGLSAETEPAADYVARLVADGLEIRRDKWYENPFVAWYFISRALCQSTRFAVTGETIVSRVRATAGDDGRFGNDALDTALSICTLLSWQRHENLERAVAFLLESQGEHGSWPRIAFYRGGPTRWGSEELTTAICVEALSRYRDR